MNILFHIPYDVHVKNRWDGEMIRHGGAAVSGTHQTLVLVAEYLAKYTNHQIYVLNNCYNKTYKGVHYVELAQNLPNDIHTLVVLNWTSYIPISNVRALQHVIAWYQCPEYNYSLHQVLFPLSQTSNARISFMHVSEWSKSNVFKAFSGFYPLCKSITIPNALMIDCLPPNIDFGVSRPNTAIFFACWERGGVVAERCWEKVCKVGTGFGDFIKLNYAGGNQKGDKTCIFNTYANARYFIYPLINPDNGLIHRDTFACVVAEAIACGVEVLTYPVAALKEYYDGLVTWIPMPPTVTVDDVDSPYPTPSIPALGHESHDDVIVKLLMDINTNYEQRTALRQERAQKVRERFDPENLFAPWVDLVN